jgi:hypothetical protein
VSRLSVHAVEWRKEQPQKRETVSDRTAKPSRGAATSRKEGPGGSTQKPTPVPTYVSSDRRARTAVTYPSVVHRESARILPGGVKRSSRFLAERLKPPLD